MCYNSLTCATIHLHVLQFTHLHGLQFTYMCYDSLTCVTIFTYMCYSSVRRCCHSNHTLYRIACRWRCIDSRSGRRIHLFYRQPLQNIQNRNNESLHCQQCVLILHGNHQHVPCIPTSSISFSHAWQSPHVLISHALIYLTGTCAF